MASLSELKRLIREDFSPDDQELIGKIANILNPSLQEIYSAINGNLTVTDNINMQLKELEISVDSAGIPKVPTSYKSELKGSTRGIHCVKAENLTSTVTYPISCPFVSFE